MVNSLRRSVLVANAVAPTATTRRAWRGVGEVALDRPLADDELTGDHLLLFPPRQARTSSSRAVRPWAPPYDAGPSSSARAGAAPSSRNASRAGPARGRRVLVAEHAAGARHQGSGPRALIGRADLLPALDGAAKRRQRRHGLAAREGDASGGVRRRRGQAAAVVHAGHRPQIGAGRAGGVDVAGCEGDLDEGGEQLGTSPRPRGRCGGTSPSARSIAPRAASGRPCASRRSASPAAARARGRSRRGRPARGGELPRSRWISPRT